jgi:hypothetical protein
MKRTNNRPARTTHHLRRRTVVDAAAVVRTSLEHYASRGAFRSFSEVPLRGRLIGFKFLWFRDVTFRVTCDPRTRTLTFVDLLPGVAARSGMDRALRAFVASRSAPSLPGHRRVDRKKVGVSVVNRKGALSLVFTLKPAHVEYGTRKAVHLVHEILMDFLNDSLYIEYQIEHFNFNPEMA